MRQQSINLIGGFYADDSRLWSAQDTCNWLPMVAEQAGTLTPSGLRTPPGLKPYQQIGDGPIRGMYNCEGLRLVVSGRTLFKIANNGVGQPLGSVPGVGRVSFSHNQFKGGNQVLVTNGLPGGGYVYDTTAQHFDRISDPGFPGSLMTDYVDSYLLGVSPDGRFWFHSNLADATDYNTLDRYEAEAAPDRIVGLAVNQFEVIVFGQRTVEFFGNAGGATGTFQSKRVVIERGCASRHTIAKMDNSVIWLGDDGIVYRLNGYQAQRISTVPLERAIANNRWGDAFAFEWEDKGHKVYYLTLPDGHTWGYDVVSGLWHRRQSYGMDRWRPNDLVKWSNDWFAGDFQNGRIWRLDWEYPAEGTDPMVSERTSPVYSDSQSAFLVNSAELVIAPGQTLTANGVGQRHAELDGGFPDQPPRPTIEGAAPDGTKASPYSYAYTASGGTGALTFSISYGNVPSGVTMNSSGELSGTPAMVASYTYTVRVTDENGMWAELVDVVRIVGGIVALATDDYLFERISGNLTETVPIDFDVLARSMAISPNGAFIACGASTGDKLYVARINGDRSGYVQVPLDTLPGDTVEGVDFHPTGEWLVAAVKSSSLMRVYKVDAEEFELVDSLSLDQAAGPRFSRDGKWIVCGTGVDAPRRGIAAMPFDPETGEIGSATHPSVTGNVSSSSLFSEFSPNGKYIAAGNDNRLLIWGFSNGVFTLLFSQVNGVPASSRGVHWSPDGRYLYTVSAFAEDGKKVVAYEWNGSSLSSPVYPADQPTSVTVSDSSLSSDGKQLVIGLGGTNPNQALYVYNVNGTELTLADRPVTTASNANAVRWTGVPLD